jgi:cyclic pyranopterin phosphate synthase
MVDISGKKIVYRSATAVGKIKLKKSTIKMIQEARIKKGDPLSVAEISAILAVKKTPELIPLCHNIPIKNVDLEFSFKDEFIESKCTVVTHAQTGVEMEALMGLTTALMNIWDMTKYLEKTQEGQYPDTVITDIRLLEKRKGK